MITRDEADLIATAISVVRPDWNPNRILAVLSDERIRLRRTYRATFHAALAIALDPETRAPTRLLEAGPYWRLLPDQDAPSTTRAAIDFATACSICFGPEHPPIEGDHDYADPAGREPVAMPKKLRKNLRSGGSRKW